METATEEPLGRLLSLTTKVVQAHYDARLAERGASLPTFIVLKHAMERNGVNQRELAEGMGIEAPTLVRHLDRLEHDGLVERQRDPHDRRAIRVRVTPAGRKRFRSLVDVMAASNNELKSLLSPAEERAFARVLTRIREHYRLKREESV